MGTWHCVGQIECTSPSVSKTPKHLDQVAGGPRPSLCTNHICHMLGLVWKLTGEPDRPSLCPLRPRGKSNQAAGTQSGIKAWAQHAHMAGGKGSRVCPRECQCLGWGRSGPLRCLGQQDLEAGLDVRLASPCRGLGWGWCHQTRDSSRDGLKKARVEEGKPVGGLVHSQGDGQGWGPGAWRGGYGSETHLTGRRWCRWATCPCCQPVPRFFVENLGLFSCLGPTNP